MSPFSPSITAPNIAPSLQSVPRSIGTGVARVVLQSAGALSTLNVTHYTRRQCPKIVVTNFDADHGSLAPIRIRCGNRAHPPKYARVSPAIHGRSKIMYFSDATKQSLSVPPRRTPHDWQKREYVNVRRLRSVEMRKDHWDEKSMAGKLAFGSLVHLI